LTPPTTPEIDRTTLVIVPGPEYCGRLTKVGIPGGRLDVKLVEATNASAMPALPVRAIAKEAANR
jgi:hypothetical protein